MKRLFLSAAVLPLLAAADAGAETTISTAVTTPVATSSAANGQPDDVTIAASGSVKPTTAGAAVTIDSDNDVVNRGAIAQDGKSNAVGVLILGGRTGSLQNFGTISLVEDFTATDTDSDGDLDGPFAQGSGRFGVRLVGPGAFTGDIAHLAGGSITVEGNDSGGIVLDSAVIGSVRSGGAVTVTGDRSVGLRAADVSGAVSVTGSLQAQGAGAVALDLTGDVGGRLTLQNTIAASGYRITARPVSKEARAKLDADDLLQGGPAVRIAGDVVGGVLLDVRPADASSTDADEDDDGVNDADEANGSVSSYGAAPAIDIGGAGAVSIGVVGTGSTAYGLLLRGAVLGAGVYDGVAATGIRVGQVGGGATSIAGGIRLDSGGVVEATAFEADATALRLNAGAATPLISNGGRITATSASEAAKSATAVLLEAGAAVPVLRNSREITAQVQGETGTATAILDRSGALGRIENTGVIRALLAPTDDADDTDDSDNDPANETLSGRTVAIDLRANTAGAVVLQTGVADGDDGGDGQADPDADGDGVDDADEPSIQGEVLFGSGADQLELRNGVLAGAVSFGAGADQLLIDGGARLTGALSDSDGLLSVTVGKGTLELTSTDTVRLTSLNIGGDGALLATIDGATGKASKLEVSGAASLAAGAELNLRFTSLVKQPTSFVVIDAGALQAGQLDADFADTPFLYAATLRTDLPSGEVAVDVRRRTAAELGFNRSQAAAYDAVFASLDQSAAVEQAILDQVDREGFTALYNQLLPDHSGGSLMSAAAVNTAIGAAINGHTGDSAAPGATGVWAQQIFFSIEQDAEDALGYESDGFGFAAGVEEVFSSHSAYGLSASFVAVEFNDQQAAAGEQISMNYGEVGAYGRWARGGFRADARLGLGYAMFDSERRVTALADGLNAVATADWTGWLVSGRVGAAYHQAVGRYYVRPELSLDYVRLEESEYEEGGAGAGVDLDVESRSGDLATGSALLALGARWGSGFRWGPEVKVGWRQHLAGEVGETTARFRGASQSFTLAGEDPFDGGAIARLALTGTGERTFVALEGGAELDDSYTQYDVRAVVKFSF